MDRGTTKSQWIKYASFSIGWMAIWMLGLSTAIAWCEPRLPYMHLDEPSDRISASQWTEVVQSIIETILAEHVDPPTRQQMVLEVIRQLGTLHNKPISAELSLAVSDAGDQEHLYALFANEVKTIVGEEASRAVALSALNGISKWLEGGFALERQFNVIAEEQLSANRYVGIGVQTGMTNNGKSINFMKIFENGPAFDAGIRDNDILEAVDGKPIEGMSMAEAVQLIRGPAGTSVQLTVRTPGDSTREFSLVRRVIPLKTLEVVEVHKEKRAILVRLDRISPSSLNELQKSVEQAELNASKVTTVVLDLRKTLVDDIHYFHLFADGLLDATTVCKVQTRKGIRTLKTEDGKALDDRTIVLVCSPEQSTSLRLLAAVYADQMLPVYWTPGRDPFGLSPLFEPAVMEAVEVKGTDYFIKIATSRFLDGKGKPVSQSSNLFGDAKFPEVSKLEEAELRPAGALLPLVLSALEKSR